MEKKKSSAKEEFELEEELELEDDYFGSEMQSSMLKSKAFQEE